MRVLYAAERFRDVPEGSTRLEELPLCPGECGDILGLARFLRAGRDLSQALTSRRDAVVRSSWLPHEEFGDLARSVLASWGPQGA